MSTMRMSGPDRREQILDVTRAIVGERGFHAVSIEAVARAAGITRPIVYEHFESLGGLLPALFALGIANLLAAVLAVAAQLHYRSAHAAPAR